MVLLYWLACTKPSDGDSATPPDSGTPTPTTETGTGPGTDTATTPPPPGSPVLTVDGGYGGGTFAAGDEVHVWAAVDPQAEVVVAWQDDSGILASPLEWNSAATLPDHDVTVTPVIEAVPLPIERRTYDLDGRSRDALVVEAAGARGAVLFFHGGAYAIDQLESNAGASIARTLVRGGYTVVAVMSESEAAFGAGGWNDSLDLGSNTDLQNVAALVAALRADGTVADGLPIVAWGKSSGGNFAHAVGAAGLADAVVAYCAAGGSDTNAATAVPTAWYMAENDGTFPSGADDAAVFQANLDARGIPTDLVVHPPTPLYDQRFERVTGIDAARSAQIADELRANGALNARDQWVVSGVAAVSGLSVAGLTSEQLTAVGAEIEIMAADHELYDDVAARMLGFLDANL